MYVCTYIHTGSYTHCCERHAAIQPCVQREKEKEKTRMQRVILKNTYEVVHTYELHTYTEKNKEEKKRKK